MMQAPQVVWKLNEELDWLLEVCRKLKICSYLQELIDVEGDGMADMVFRCIQEMDIDNRMTVLIIF